MTPNFTIVEPTGGRPSHNYFKSVSELNNATKKDYSSAKNYTEEGRADAKMCHFHMGFESTYGPRVASTPIINGHARPQQNATQQKPQVRVTSNIRFGSDAKGTPQTSNQSFFRWIQPKIV